MTTLTADNEELLQELISTGKFASSDEAIRQALLAMKVKVVASAPSPDSLPIFGAMKGTVEIKGDIISPIPGWFGDSDEQ